MNIQPDVAPRNTPGATLESPTARPAIRPFYWSIRREIWENRSLYIAPLVAMGLVLLGFVLSTVTLSHEMRALAVLPPPEQAAELAKRYGFSGMVVLVTSLMVGFFYCLGALHGERSDRSILFWKSLPVSDLTTVLSKLFIPLAVLPVITFVVIVCMQLLMLIISTEFLQWNHQSAALLWSELPFFQLCGGLFYSMVVLALWHSPIYAWLLLVSSWARRTTFLWAVLPPLALCMLEKIANGTDYLGQALIHRVAGFGAEAFSLNTKYASSFLPISPDPGHFVVSGGLWIGLVLAAGLITTTVWMRRNRDPM